jgi:hypothetical protein
MNPSKNTVDQQPLTIPTLLHRCKEAETSTRLLQERLRDGARSCATVGEVGPRCLGICARVDADIALSEERSAAFALFDN